MSEEEKKEVEERFSEELESLLNRIKDHEDSIQEVRDEFRDHVEYFKELTNYIKSLKDKIEFEKRKFRELEKLKYTILGVSYHPESEVEEEPERRKSRDHDLVYFKVGIPRNLLDAIIQGADAEVYESLKNDALAMQHLLEVGHGEFFFEGEENIEIEKLFEAEKRVGAVRDDEELKELIGDE